HAGVRRHGIRLAEGLVNKDAQLGMALLARLNDPDAQVRLQLAYTLGACRDAGAAKGLATMAMAHGDDPYLIAAVLSSAREDSLRELLVTVLSAPQPPPRLTQQLLSLAAVMNDGRELPFAITSMTQPRDGQFALWQMTALAATLDALDRRG